jgi:Family of unknown function (DUF6093)
MSAESVVLAGRVFEGGTFPAECVITRSGEAVLNEVTAEYETPDGAVVYSGPCDLRFSSAVIREVDAVARPGVEQEPVLRLPVAGSEGVRVNDVAEITAHSLDAGMVGVRVRIAGVHGGAVTARRLPVEVTS